MDILTVSHLTKIYGEGEAATRALDDVSFSVEEGEFVAIVGSSGSGKSTLLHLIGGVDRPTSGHVLLNGADVYARSDEELAVFRRRQVGLIYQFYNLIPTLSVEQNIKLPMLLDKRRPDEAYFRGLVAGLGLEDKLKAYVQEKISRGKVDVFLQIETLEETDVQVLVNHSLASAYVQALRELKERYQLADDVSLALLSKYSDVFSVHKAPENEEAVWEAVRQVADIAIESFLKMREAEGERLKADILEKARDIISLVDQVEQVTPETVENYRERLRAKIEELLGDNHMDEQRVLTEVAIFADKVAVDEETVRLRSHFQQLQKLVDSQGPVGRKIDFLVQEMNREANTIGSKSVNSKIAYLVVDIKALIEKIREQVQNVE